MMKKPTYEKDTKSKIPEKNDKKDFTNDKDKLEKIEKSSKQVKGKNSFVVSGKN
jgi:hypothetical protein